MASIGLWLIALTGVLTGAIFAVAPDVELDIAAWMQDSETRAALKPLDWLISAIRELNFRLTIAILSVAGAVVAFHAIRKRSPLRLPNRMALLVLLSFALGPGLLANGLLKEYWSRPRPYSVVELGGHHPFKAWWDTSGACERNCSFVSGEASSAFALLAVAVLASGPWRYAAIAVAVAYGLMVGFVRMTAGGHFLTDVIFAGVLTALVVWLLHGYLFRWRRAGGALALPRLRQRSGSRPAGPAAGYPVSAASSAASGSGPSPR